MNAKIFIWVAIIIIAVYDILLGVFKKKYITDIFREWYLSKPFAPFAVGVIAIGHFQSLLPVSCIPLFAVLGGLFLVWCILMDKTKIKFSRGFYVASQRYFFIPMAIGSLVGILWH